MLDRKHLLSSLQKDNPFLRRGRLSLYSASASVATNYYPVHGIFRHRNVDIVPEPIPAHSQAICSFPLLLHTSRPQIQRAQSPDILGLVPF